MINPQLEAGADVLGSTNYPGGDIWISPSGNDTTGNGTKSSPYATITKGFSKTPTGGTLVLRGGVYFEGTATPASHGIVINRPVTIQNEPGEAVWLDGSVPVTNWTADSNKWRTDFVATFDRSPTYSRGAVDSTQPGWQFINPQYPCAAWPEQVFVEGNLLKQVDSLDKVVKGTFYVEGVAHGPNNTMWTSSRYWIGNNPKGKSVRISKLVSTILAWTTDFTIRGIGIRRYANSVPDFGAIKINKDRGLIENCIIKDIANTGVWIYSSKNTVIRKTTIKKCGLVGGGGDRADNLTLDRVSLTDNTLSMFNSAPVSGGWKLAHSQFFTVKDSVISDNYQHGLWCDEAVYQIDVINTHMENNGGYGGIAEISEGSRWINCLFTNNVRGNLLVQNTNNSEVWNCTFAYNGGAAFKLIQDPRRPSQGKALDNRFPLSWYEANCTWKISSFIFNNNVVVDPGRQYLSSELGYGFYILSQERPMRGWATFGPQMNGNLYSRTIANDPINMFLLAQENKNAAGWSTFPPYKVLVSPRESTSVELRGQVALEADMTLSQVARDATVNTPIPLPEYIASKLGVPAGTKHLGVF